MESLFDLDRPSKASVKLMVMLAVFLFAGTIFMWNNHGLYSTPLAKIVDVQETFNRTESGMDDTEEDYYDQKVTARLMNGVNKGAIISLDHLRSESGVYDENLQEGDDIFVSYHQDLDEWSLDGVKRDQFLALASAIFILAVALVGRYRGILSIISVIVNILVFTLVINLYLKGVNILVPTIFAVIFFSIFSLLLYCGFRLLTFVAILTTLCGLGASMLIMLIVIAQTNYDGVWVESIDFLIIETDYRSVFFAGILIGGLGGIMDIAITITSSLFELKGDNPEMTSKELMESGKNIGRDIMGTMVNVMFFTFLGGSLPIILLSVKNGYRIIDYLTNFATLEIVRFLVGGIGLVVTIPISLYIVIFILQKRGRKS
ncbi:MAG TPA: YibE/F family protein [Proteiniclasticum sp.]|nr:YibE/F family protein [Proteiniclasticum sp.]